MKTITKQYNVFNLDELNDKAQRKAYEKYFANFDFSFYQECIIEDAKQIGELMGIDITNVYYSGFYSQGDGACFTGGYGYRKNSVKDVMEYAPQDKDLHNIVKTLANIQKRNFYELYASVSHSGHYSHELCTIIDVERDNYNGQEVNENDENDVIDCLRDFMCWIYKQLKNEYDYLTSFESFQESAKENEWTFLETGELFYE